MHIEMLMKGLRRKNDSMKPNAGIKKIPHAQWRILNL